ncbi:hypothetical protein [Streptomyces hypolithicus]
MSDSVHAAHGEPGDPAQVGKVRAAWDVYRTSDNVPRVLTQQMNRDVDALTAAVKARDAELTRGAALRVAQNDLDLHLRYEPLATVEADRMELWARQLKVDATAEDAGAVAGDVTGLELTWERVRHSTENGLAERISGQLRELRGAADRKDTAAAVRLEPRQTARRSGLRFRDLADRLLGASGLTRPDWARGTRNVPDMFSQ